MVRIRKVRSCDCRLSRERKNKREKKNIFGIIIQTGCGLSFQLPLPPPLPLSVLVFLSLFLSIYFYLLCDLADFRELITTGVHFLEICALSLSREINTRFAPIVARTCGARLNCELDYRLSKRQPRKKNRSKYDRKKCLARATFSILRNIHAEKNN